MRLMRPAFDSYVLCEGEVCAVIRFGYKGWAAGHYAAN